MKTNNLKKFISNTIDKLAIRFINLIDKVRGYHIN